jgi:hypothetical protein
MISLQRYQGAGMRDHWETALHRVSKRIPSRWYLTLALSAFFCAATFLWLALNHAPSQWDDSWYLTNGLTMFDALGEGGLPGYAAKSLTILRIKPPLIPLLPPPAYLLFGRKARAAFAVNLAAMLALFLSLDAIARRIRNARVGWIAVYMAGTMPLLYGLSHWYLIECSLTAFVCLTLYLVIRAIETPTGGAFFWLGVVCGLGVLLRTTFPVYVALPILYLLVRVASESRLTIAKLGALAAPAILLPLPWYALNFRSAIGRAILSGFSTEAAFYGTGPVFSPAALRRYMQIVLNAGPSPYYGLLAGVLVLLLGLRGKLRVWWGGWPKDARALLVLSALPFLVFLFGRSKDVKYVAPFLPVLALATASLLDQAVGALKWKGVFTCLLLAFPMLAFLQASFGVLGDTQFTGAGLVFAATQLPYANVYDPQGWPHRQILERIVRASAFQAGEQKIVMIGSDRAGFNANNFELAAVRDRLPLRIVTSAYETDLPSALSHLRSASFFVYKDGGEPESDFYNRLQPALLQAVRNGGSFHEIPGGFPLPDGGVARIFRNASLSGNLKSAAFIPSGVEKVDPCGFDFGGQIQLTGLAFEQTAESLAVHLRWRCVKPPGLEYRCFIHILDRNGKVIGQLDHDLAADNPPALTWLPGDIAFENLLFPLPADRSGGAYRLRLGLFDPQAGDRLPATILSGGSGFSLADGSTAVLTPGAPGPM